MLTVGSDIALGAAQTDDLAGVHDIDAALGNPGAATPWLAAALAVENARQRGEPQLIACKEARLAWQSYAPGLPQGTGNNLMTHPKSRGYAIVVSAMTVAIAATAYLMGDQLQLAPAAKSILCSQCSGKPWWPHSRLPMSCTPAPARPPPQAPT